VHGSADKGDSTEETRGAGCDKGGSAEAVDS
jgi:hypothetical protein